MFCVIGANKRQQNIVEPVDMTVPSVVVDSHQCTTYPRYGPVSMHATLFLINCLLSAAFLHSPELFPEPHVLHSEACFFLVNSLVAVASFVDSQWCSTDRDSTLKSISNISYRVICYGIRLRWHLLSRKTFVLALRGRSFRTLAITRWTVQV